MVVDNTTEDHSGIFTISDQPAFPKCFALFLSGSRRTAALTSQPRLFSLSRLDEIGGEP